MSGYRVSCSFVSLWFVLSMAVMDSAVADEKDDWGIGRVFMSRAERLMLDNMRNSPQLKAAVPTSSTANGEVLGSLDKKRKPTGYILPSDGSPYRWEGGDFQKTSRGSIAQSDGEDEIEITKHQRATRPDSSPAPKNDEAKPTVSSDSDRQPDHASEQ